MVHEKSASNVGNRPLLESYVSGEKNGRKVVEQMDSGIHSNTRACIELVDISLQLIRSRIKCRFVVLAVERIKNFI